VRVVIDRHLRIPPTMRVISDARAVSTWVLTLPSADPERRRAFLRAGAAVIDIDPSPDRDGSLAAALKALGERGITRLLVEGGGHLAAAFARAGLVDRLVWAHAPILIGADGIPAVAEFGLEMLSQAPGFERLSTETVGDDVLTVFRVRERMLFAASRQDDRVDVPKPDQERECQPAGE
jgi:diaminohydroxyphosphoribosylaminopyrimidine deaminase/5-amino-6-(5-phosphoribosylamino)uracil reductase